MLCPVMLLMLMTGTMPFATNCNKQVRDHLHHMRTPLASSRRVTASPFPSVRISVGEDPPPATLVLSGELKHQSVCLGAYTLVAGRSAHGSPAWRHERGDRYIAQLASGNWAVQKEEKVGVSQDAFLFLADANVMFPHQSRMTWQETDDKGRWFAGEGLKCDAVGYEISESKARRAAGQIVKGNARMPGVDFEAEAADAVFDLIDVESTGVVRPGCRSGILLRSSSVSALRHYSLPVDPVFRISLPANWSVQNKIHETKQRYDTIATRTDQRYDTHTAYQVRPHELLAFTSLIDSDATDDISRIHERLVEGGGGDGIVRRQTFRQLYPSLLKPLVVEQACVFELALSACLKVAHAHDEYVDF